jgi:hypothetical protein
MPKYRAGTVQLDIPDGYEDVGFAVLVSPKGEGFRDNLVAQHEEDSKLDLAARVKRLKDEYRTGVDKAAFVAQSEATVGGDKALLVDVTRPIENSGIPGCDKLAHLIALTQGAMFTFTTDHRRLDAGRKQMKELLAKVRFDGTGTHVQGRFGFELPAGWSFRGQPRLRERGGEAPIRIISMGHEPYKKAQGDLVEMLRKATTAPGLKNTDLGPTTERKSALGSWSTWSGSVEAQEQVPAGSKQKGAWHPRAFATGAIVENGRSFVVNVLGRRDDDVAATLASVIERATR